MSVYISTEIRRRVRERFADCCAYCRTAERLTVAIFELDHITPISAGGTTVFENICFACPTCNRFKASQTIGVDPETREQANLFHPHRDSWSEHFSWSNDATEIIGLTSTGRATIDVLKMNRPQLIRVRRMWADLEEHPPIIE